VLKAPKIKRLKLRNYELLSSFAFESNLRRYIKEQGEAFKAARGQLVAGEEQARANTRSRYSST
jgi:hypothetical protein